MSWIRNTGSRCGGFGSVFRILLCSFGSGRLILIRTQKGIKMAPRQRKITGKRSSVLCYLLILIHIEIFIFVTFWTKAWIRIRMKYLIWRLSPLFSSVSQEKVMDIVLSSVQVLAIGQSFQLFSRINPPPSPPNPAGYLEKEG
jgi:hypothetical protein